MGRSWLVSPRIAHVVSSEDRVVLLHLDRPSDRPQALLGTGAAIWLRLAPTAGSEPVAVDETELLCELADMYGAEIDDIRADVGAFLDELASRDFVQLV